MRLLLDTHALLWVLEDAGRLSMQGARALNDPANEKVVSIASFWEMAIKRALKKLTMRTPPEEVLTTFDRESIATILPIGAGHLRALQSLPHHHRDPFDRMLVAQALSDGLTLVSNDELLDDYGVQRLW